MTTAVKPAVKQQQTQAIGEWGTVERPFDTTAATAAPQQDKPAGPRDWTIGQIIEALSRPLPESMLKTRKQGGANLAYIPWHTVNRILDKYAIGWTWEITNTVVTLDRFIITGRLTIPAQEGNIYREATGTEALKEEYYDKEAKEKRIREIAYGDVSSNAEGQCFRRCAARFGLGLYLYSEKK